MHLGKHRLCLDLLDKGICGHGKFVWLMLMNYHKWERPISTELHMSRVQRRATKCLGIGVRFVQVPFVFALGWSLLCLPLWLRLLLLLPSLLLMLLYQTTWSCALVAFVVVPAVVFNDVLNVLSFSRFMMVQDGLTVAIDELKVIISSPTAIVFWLVVSTLKNMRRSTHQPLSPLSRSHAYSAERNRPKTTCSNHRTSTSMSAGAGKSPRQHGFSDWREAPPLVAVAVRCWPNQASTATFLGGSHFHQTQPQWRCKMVLWGRVKLVNPPTIC